MIQPNQESKMPMLAANRPVLETALDKLFAYPSPMKAKAAQMAEYLFPGNMRVVAGFGGFARWAMDRACGCTHINSRRYVIKHMDDGKWGIGRDSYGGPLDGPFWASRGKYETVEEAIEGATRQNWHDGEMGYEYVVVIEDSAETPS